MKALIICSVHALCKVSAPERKAISHACALHGIPVILTRQGHAHVLAKTTMLGFLSDLPGSTGQRQALIDSYLDILNDEIWNVSVPPNQSTFVRLLDPKGYARPTGFVSDYPMLTTNLLRSSALMTDATKLGKLTALSDPLKVPCIAESLAVCAASLNVIHSDVEVLVAHRRDYTAARSIGMHPRFVEELQPASNLKKKRCGAGTRLSTAAMIESEHTQQKVQTVVRSS